MTPGAFVLFGLLFGVLAGACAFVIAYGEYKRNWAFVGNPMRQALRTAFVTFLFFFLASCAVPWVLQVAVRH